MPGKWEPIFSEPFTLGREHRGYLEAWACPFCSCKTPELTPWSKVAVCCFLSMMAHELGRRAEGIDAGA